MSQTAQGKPPVVVPDVGADYPDPVAGVLKWVKRASVAGVVLSLIAHLIVVGFASLLTVRYPDADAGGGAATQQVDFAVLTESELTAMLPADIESSDPLVPESQIAPNPLLTDLARSTVSTESLSDADLDIEIDTGAGDIGETDGSGLVTGTGGGGGGASFFGLEAQGSRFAYIVDRSSSMRGDKMTKTRAELTRSIMGLAENGEFLVIFYSDQADVLAGRMVWRDATERSKSTAASQIRRVEPEGGTKPMGAFELVFGQRIRPDAIYFMTDGRFSDDIPGKLAALNRNARIPIHCILFGEPGQGSVLVDEVRTLMKRIADDSGGQFSHVGVTP